MLIAAVVLLRFYPYATIYHVKRKGKYKIDILLRFRLETATIDVNVKIFKLKLTF